MIPLFKTHYSIGKSILNVESETKEGGADSVIELAKKHKIEKVVFVEDQMHGFLKTKSEVEKNNLDFVFGLRLPVSDNYEQKETHKIVIFAKNDEGIKKLYKIYSEANCGHEGRITLEDLSKHWNGDDLLLFIPFYDSYIHRNNFSFDSFVPNFNGLGKVSFFIESNLLPIDVFLREKVESVAKASNASVVFAKSIYYKKREDLKAYQTFRIISLRKGGKATNISRPELEECGSSEFCIESWAEKCEI